MMERFEEIEKKISQQSARPEDKKLVTPDGKNELQLSTQKNANLLVSVTKLQRIEDTFEEEQSVLGVQKI